MSSFGETTGHEIGEERSCERPRWISSSIGVLGQKGTQQDIEDV
jgi:hypothetical protein